MKPKYKGDTIQIYVTIDSDITDWKIRAEIYDNAGGSVKLATANSGGSDTQIYKQLSGASSIFIIYVPSATTTNLEDDAFIEIEVDTGETIGGVDEIITVYKGKLQMLKENITWTDPS